MSAHIIGSQDISDKGKLTVSFRVLLSLYAIIPVCFVLAWLFKREFADQAYAFFIISNFVRDATYTGQYVCIVR